ncbi:unnamed protein product [Blepharisma stoltei]|uniref:Uncharacterized protein n=1 Tax=Blepharisma stoltei TaxID=1481888 RepID=A0AAU9JLN6_9CILI|nr:unnamed protein product [Blepharisma stoltei]
MKSFSQEGQGIYQGRTQADNLIRSNQFYVAQVSQMEVKISELKALLQAKDSEISYLKKKVTSLEEEKRARNSISMSSQVDELKSRNAELEEENKELRNRLNHAELDSDTKIQLEHAIRMKEIFEQKYRDVKSMMIKAEMGSPGNEDTIRSQDYYKDDWKNSFLKPNIHEDNTRKISEEKQPFKRKSVEIEKNFIDLKHEYEMAMEKIKEFDLGSKTDRSSSFSSISVNDSQSRSYKSLVTKNKASIDIEEKTLSPSKMSPFKHSSSPQTSYKPQLLNGYLKLTPDSPASKPPLGIKKGKFKIIPNNREHENSIPQSINSSLDKAQKTGSILKTIKEDKGQSPLSISTSSWKKEQANTSSSFTSRNNLSTSSIKKEAEYYPLSMRNARLGTKKGQVVIDFDKYER